MDGNGRWATQKGMQRVDGHTRGVEVANEIMIECVNLGIEYATFYAFSSQNWLRDKAEIDHLFKLAKDLFKKMRVWVLEKNVKFQTIGNIEYLPEEVKELIENFQKETKDARGTVLSVCISYGGREEILDIFRKIHAAQKDLKEMTTKLVSDFFTVPDLDLVIRTSGEYRISNFLLWQSAYAEYYFTKVNWPDFTTSELKEALDSFSSRKRRFGGIPKEEEDKEDDTMSIELKYEYVKLLYSEYRDSVDLLPLYEILKGEGYSFPDEFPDEDKRGILHKYSHSSESAIRVAYILDDVIDGYPMAKQIEYIQYLYKDFSIETLELVCKNSLGKPELRELMKYFVETTPREKGLLKKCLECDYYQRTSPELLDKFIYRILSTYYYTVLTIDNSFISEDKRILYSAIICFSDDCMDEEDDLPEIKYITPDIYPFISSVLDKIWNSPGNEQYKKSGLFLGISFLLYRMYPETTKPPPKTLGDCFHFILNSVDCSEMYEGADNVKEGEKIDLNKVLEGKIKENESS